MTADIKMLRQGGSLTNGVGTETSQALSVELVEVSEPSGFKHELRHITRGQKAVHRHVHNQARTSHA